MVLLSTPDRVPRTGSEIGDWPTCAADQSPEDVPGPEETYFFFLDPPFFAAFFFPPFFFAIARSPLGLWHLDRVPTTSLGRHRHGRQTTAARPERGPPRDRVA